MDVVAVAMLALAQCVCGGSLGPAAAFGAQPSDGDVVEPRLEAEPFVNHLPHRVEVVRRDRQHGAAGVAIDELARAAAHEAMQAGPMAEMDVLDDAVGLQRLQIAVYRGDVNTRTRR